MVSLRSGLFSEAFDLGCKSRPCRPGSCWYGLRRPVILASFLCVRVLAGRVADRISQGGFRCGWRAGGESPVSAG